MDRKLISHRIGSILDDISRLSNALYALDTTDIQRYPDNYETLSIDAALRAERIACRLRHLIYSSTTIRKGDYLKSAGATHGITVNCEDRALEVRCPVCCQSANSGKAMSSCWTRSILSLINTQENTHFRITAIALSVSPRSMTGHFPTGGYAITIIYRKSNYWIFSLPL